MKTLLLSLVVLLGTITLSQAQTSEMPNKGDRAEQIDQQLEQFKQSLDTFDLTTLFEQFSLPLGDKDIKPSDKTLAEIQQGLDEVIRLLDNVDVKGMESLMTEFMDNMQSLMGDLDLPSTPRLDDQNKPSQPSQQKSKIKKI